MHVPGPLLAASLHRQCARAAVLHGNPRDYAEYSLRCSWGGSDDPNSAESDNAANPPQVELPRSHAAWKRCLPDYEDDTESMPTPWKMEDQNGFQLPEIIPPRFRKQITMDGGRFVVEILVNSTVNDAWKIQHGNEPGATHEKLGWHFNVELDTDWERHHDAGASDASATDAGGG